MINLLAIFRYEVFLQRDRDKLKKLVTMNGITEDEQKELWRLVMKLDERSHKELKDLIDRHVQNGATYANSV